MRFFIFCLFAILLSFSSEKAVAQGFDVYCYGVETTADIQSCLKKHLDDAQTRLNTVYKKLEEQLPENKRAELSDLQKIWLGYRDAECLWEAQDSEPSSLKQVNDLFCMARVTDDRADVLSVLSNDTQPLIGMREYVSFPRWMNVIAKENPATYWHYESRQVFDLNCDGQDEFVMQGIEVTPVAADPSDGQASAFNNKVIVAVVENPAVGRPKSTVFKFLVTPEDSQNTLCSGDIDVQFVPNESLEGVADSCNAQMLVKTPNCIAKTIKASGKTFVIGSDSVQ